MSGWGREGNDADMDEWMNGWERGWGCGRGLKLVQRMIIPSLILTFLMAFSLPPPLPSIPIPLYTSPCLPILSVLPSLPPPPFHHTDVLVDVSLLTKGSKFAAGGSGQLYHGRFGGTPVALKELYGTLIGCLAVVWEELYGTCVCVWCVCVLLIH